MNNAQGWMQWGPVTLATLLICRVLVAEEGARATPAALAEFDVSCDGSLLLVPVAFCEDEYLFAVDTGCSDVVFDTSLKPVLGKRRSIGKLPGKAVFFELFPPPDARIGTISLRALPTVLCTDLSAVRDTEGEDICGLVGMSFLQKYIIKIDPDAGRLTFLHGGETFGGQRIDLDALSSAPQVKAMVEGYGPLELLVDTGMRGDGSLSVSASIFDELERGALITRNGVGPAFGLAGRERSNSGVLSSLTVGRSTYTGLHCRGLGDAQPNLLGLNFLLRHHVIFDFPGRCMYLEPSQQGDRFADHVLAGTGFERTERGILITGVDSAGAAAKAGLRAGDLITGVNKRRFEQLRFASIIRVFCEYGGKVSLTALRDGQSFTTSLVLPIRGGDGERHVNGAAKRDRSIIDRSPQKR